jgi:LSD1 subclass zinc finger protein
MTNEPTIRIQCPNLICRSLLHLPESTRGMVVRCAACHGPLVVPEASDEAYEQPSPPAIAA